MRKKNEDAFLVDDLLGLYIVADGMGGHQNGQLASRMAVELISEVMKNRREEVAAGLAPELMHASPVPAVLSDAVRAACAAIYEASQKDPDLHGMGTTVTVLLLGGGYAFVAQVGDSRCYLQRGERIVQITDDHSLVNEQVKAGLLTWEESRQSGLKNVITRSVGFEPSVPVDTFTLPVQGGDTFVLCSDGLSNLVDDAEIGLELQKQSFATVAQRLVELACARGGDDNVTVLCTKVESL